jgi:hypothetical protein
MGARASSVRPVLVPRGAAWAPAGQRHGISREAPGAVETGSGKGRVTPSATPILAARGATQRASRFQARGAGDR